MCGIAGYIGKIPIDEPRMLLTMEKMKNRGPDYQDYRIFRQGETNIVLLHSRLSIIDLNARSDQPFTIGDYTIVYNGEIYNYIELRKELEKQGVVFHTTSDTEVLLQYYLQYEERCVEYLEGMWSFAIYDRKKGRLLLSRDRFAEKPLYFYRAYDGIYFASEIKFLKSLTGKSFTVNNMQILRYLVNGYKSLYKMGETFFNEIEELPYATNMTIDEKLDCRITKYWQPIVKPVQMSLKEAIEGVQEHLFESVRIRLRSDVPLAFCLSGGIDSASLVSIAVKKFNCDVATFSIIDSDERYNEYDNIMATINDLECKHTLIELKYEGTLSKLHDLIEYHDIPVATITYYVHSLLSEAIAKSGYRVAFSGTGADELFTGYYDHFILHLYEVRNHPEYEKYLSDWKKNIQKFVRNPVFQNPNLYIENPRMRKHVYDDSDEFLTYLKDEFGEQFTEYHFCDSLLRNRMLNELFYEIIRVILHEDDLNSMKYSIENRSPYLDSRLFEFTNSTPVEYFICDGYGKYLLREAMKNILNDKVRLDRQKKGFNASIDSIVDFKKKVNKELLLDDGPIFDFIDRGKIEALMDSTYFSNSQSKFLFNFINAKIFLEINS